MVTLPQQTRRSAFSLVELVVVLAIAGALVASMLPAVQAARESARRASCQNNLKQISLAILMHHEEHSSCPAGGWGHRWVGIPGRGSGAAQPGSWIYNILPYVEQGALHDLGFGLAGAAADEAYSQRLTTPLQLFVCPSRRGIWTWPALASYIRDPKPFGHVSRVARSDYAINGGSSHVLSHPGPDSLSIGDTSEYWRDTTYVRAFSGVSHLRIGVNLASAVDGTGKTYLVGDKSLDPLHYEDGLSPGDNETMYSGYCTDLHRFAGMAGASNPLLPPLRDDAETINPPGFIRFGSAHANGFVMAFCDGSIRVLAYDLDPEVHFRFGHRKDEGRPLEALK